MRFHGAVGFAGTQQETTRGVFEEIITEKSYFGDVITARRSLEPPVGTLNLDVTSENSIAIVADAFALSNFETMRYVVWNGKRWTVTNVEIRRPRLILTLGGIWNGDTPGAPSGS